MAPIDEKSGGAETFGSIFKRKRVLLARLGGIQKYDSYATSSFIKSLEKELLREYLEVLFKKNCCGTRNLVHNGFGMMSETLYCRKTRTPSR